MNTLKEIVETDLSTTLGNRARSKLFGLEYSGACPWCHGTDRFHVWPDAEDIPGVGTLGRFHCMGYEAGRSGCGRKGNGIDYLVEYRGLEFAEACKLLDIDPKKLIDHRRSQKGLSPSSEHRVRKNAVDKAMGDASQAWQERAAVIASLAKRRLATCEEAQAYLHSRGLHDETLANAEIGYCPDYAPDEATKWGYKGGTMRLLRGIVIPWRDISGRVVCIRFRRLPSDESEEARKHYGVDEKTGQINRYKALFGSATGHLYMGDSLFPGCYAAMFEGEIDALVARQETDESICIVATGSTAWARSAESDTLLARSAKVLISYDANPAGDKASKYWRDRLKNAQRWRPLWNDANDMLLDGVNIGEWLAVGFSPAPRGETVVSAEDIPFVCSACGVDLNNPDENGFYDNSGIPYCEKHYIARQADALVSPIFGEMQEIRVFRADEYTLADRVAELEQQAREEWRVRQLAPRRQLAGVA